jgi:hypothetical protein
MLFYYLLYRLRADRCQAKIMIFYGKNNVILSVREAAGIGLPFWGAGCTR